MSDLDLKEAETEQELGLEPAADALADLATDALWPREQMLDRLRTCD